VNEHHRSMSDSPSAIIIGAGPSGIAMAHEMEHKLAFQDFTIYEKRDEVGGAWATNRYPGAGSDLPTHLHGFSFNLNPCWSKEQWDKEELLEYVNATVDRFEVGSHIHTSVEAVKAHWLEKTNVWCVTLKDSRTRVECVGYATVLILAVGGMNNSRDVKMEAMNQFHGDLLHIAQWTTMWGSDGMDRVRRKTSCCRGKWVFGCTAHSEAGQKCCIRKAMGSPSL
jgi:cation diffusion facilitator CzcD-associated flavoprotein CzcO